MTPKWLLASIQEQHANDLRHNYKAADAPSGEDHPIFVVVRVSARKTIVVPVPNGYSTTYDGQQGIFLKVDIQKPAK